MAVDEEHRVFDIRDLEHRIGGPAHGRLRSLRPRGGEASEQEEETGCAA
jgi:hypothetical protein